VGSASRCLLPAYFIHLSGQFKGRVLYCKDCWGECFGWENGASPARAVAVWCGDALAHAAADVRAAVLCEVGTMNKQQGPRERVVGWVFAH